jgi:ribosomal protein L16 Arg81 hydroxylase
MIEQLLGSLPVQSFRDDYYLKLPLAMAGGAAGLASLGSWEVVEQLLAQDDVDVLVGCQGESRPGPNPRPEDARGLLEDGYTIGIRRAHRHHAGLAELAAEFAADFAAPVDVHLYLTPAGQPGFGWHYDAEDVFIVQTLGSKQWSLRKNTVNPWPLVETTPQDMRYRAEMMPLMRCALAAGDWLYIPAGYWHSTEAGEESISLSIGVASLAAIDLLDALRPRLRESLRWRERLPTPGRIGLGDDELVAQYQAIAAELARELTRELTGDDFLRSVIAARRGAEQHDCGPSSRVDSDSRGLHNILDRTVNG